MSMCELAKHEKRMKFQQAREVQNLREKILLSLHRQELQSPSPTIAIGRNQRVKVEAHVARKGTSNNALPMNLPRNW